MTPADLSELHPATPTNYENELFMRPCVHNVSATDLVAKTGFERTCGEAVACISVKVGKLSVVVSAAIFQACG